MVWWIVAAVVVFSLLGLGAVLAGLGRRLAELERVAALGQERMAKLQSRLAASAARLQATLTDLQHSARAAARGGPHAGIAGSSGSSHHEVPPEAIEAGIAGSPGSASGWPMGRERSASTELAEEAGGQRRHKSRANRTTADQSGGSRDRQTQTGLRR